MKSKKLRIIYIIVMLITLTPLPVLAACSDYCKDIAPAVRIVKYGMIPLFQIVIPIALIVSSLSVKNEIRDNTLATIGNIEKKFS